MIRALALLALLLLPAPASAAEQDLTTVLEIEPGKREFARLSAVPGGARIEVEASATQPVPLQFVSAAALSGGARALYAGRIEAGLEFALRVPETGDYLILVDNREAETKTTVTLKIVVRPLSDVEVETLAVQQIAARLGELFVFEPFEVRAQPCQRATVPWSPGQVLVCREFGRMVRRSVSDSFAADGLILFETLHSMSQELLEQWGERERARSTRQVDEMTAVIFELLGYSERLARVSRWVLEHPEAIEKMGAEVPLGERRLDARRLRGLNEMATRSDLLADWQQLLLPHMQTPVLEALRKRNPAWLDRGLVARTLEARS